MLRAAVPIPADTAPLAGLQAVTRFTAAEQVSQVGCCEFLLGHERVGAAPPEDPGGHVAGIGGSKHNPG